MRYRRMRGRKIKEKEGAATWWYIRSTSDILPKGKHMRSIADIKELYDISCYLKKIHIIYSNINVLKEIKNIQGGLHKGRHLNV
jgi:hypothetical protein